MNSIYTCLADGCSYVWSETKVNSVILRNWRKRCDIYEKSDEITEVGEAQLLLLDCSTNSIYPCWSSLREYINGSCVKTFKHLF